MGSAGIVGYYGGAAGCALLRDNPDSQRPLRWRGQDSSHRFLTDTLDHGCSFHPESRPRVRTGRRMRGERAIADRPGQAAMSSRAIARLEILLLRGSFNQNLVTSKKRQGPRWVVKRIGRFRYSVQIF